MKRFFFDVRLWALAVALVTSMTFAQVATFDFVNLDDQAHIEQNEALKAFDLGHIWTHEHKDMFIPVFYTTLAIEALIAPKTPTFHPPNLHVKNLDPLVFHATSIMLHVGNAVLVFYFLLGFAFAAPVAAMGALVYAVHPLQVEVVAWVSAQKDLISSFWALLSLIYFQRKFILKDRRSIRDFWILSGLVLFAILSKPTTIIFAPLMLIWWAYLKRRDWFSGALWLSVPLFFSAIFALVTAKQQPASNLPFQTNFFERVWISLDTITFYLMKLIAPVNLTVEYGRNPPYFLNSPDRYWTWIPAALLIGLIYRYWRRFSEETKLGLLLSGIAIFPVLGLKSFVYQNVSTVSDRYMSVPLIGIALVLCSVLSKMVRAESAAKNQAKNLKWQVPSAIVCGILVFIFAGTSINISKHWRNIDSLWARVIAINPRSWFAYNNWAAHYEQKNERPRAIELYENSLELRPDSMVNTRVGILYYDENRLDKAREKFQEALRLDPSNAIARQNLGVL